MKKALIMAPMGSVHRRFNQPNIKALLDLGYEVHLLANFEDGEGAESHNSTYAETEKSRGIIIHSLPFARHSLLKNINNVFRTRQLLKDNHFDIIHTHTETGGLILRLCGKRKDSSYIYTSHGFSFYKGSPIKNQLFYRPIEKWICQGMDIYIAINKEDFDIQNRWNQNKSRFTHGVGIDIHRFDEKKECNESIRKEFGIPENAKMILSIGELDDNKNHRIVLEAISAIERKDLYYVICGVGPNRDKLIKTADDLGMANRAILAGFRSDIPNVIAASDIFVFPSYHEGLPVALMEAMAGGLPVVASDIRGVKDLIVNNENGFLVSPGNKKEFSDKINILLDDRSLASSYVERSKFIIEQYSYQKVFDELRMLYQEAECSED